MATNVTSQIQGITINEALKAPCATVATTNITLSGYQTISGVTITSASRNKRVLAVGQTDPVENGIYDMDSSAWQRSKDFDGNRDVVSGTLVLVRSSGADGAIYEVTTADPIVIDTTGITFALRDDPATTYPQTQSEIAAGVVPVNYAYQPGRVKRYGASLNSATLQLALNGNAGEAIYLSADPYDTHTLTTALSVPVNTDILVDGDGTAILDASTASLSGSGLIVCVGTLGATLGGGLAGAVAKGAVSVTLNSAPTLSPGDETILRNATDASWNGDNGSYRQGEVLIVKSVSGAVVTFSSAVIDAYASSCTLHKVTSTSTKIKGKIEIRGNTADTAGIPTIFIKYGRGNVVDGVVFRNTTATCLEFSDCYDFEARIDTGKYLTDAGSIQASGVIAGGQKGYIHDSILHASRHGGSTGGGGTIVSRYVVFERCDIASRQQSSADFHGCAEFCEYRNCKIDGAVNLSGARNRLIDNDIRPHATQTSLINMEACKSIDCTIRGNRFNLTGSVVRYVLDANASTDINANTTEDGTLVLSDNDIIDETTLDQSYIFVRNNGSTADLQIVAENNRITKTDTSKYGNLFAVSVVSGSNFKKITHRNNIYDLAGFGVCSGVDSFRLGGTLGYGTTASSSPAFGSTTFEPSIFDFELKISLTAAATAFTLFNPDTAKFVPTMIAGRVDADVTATNGNYLGVGVNAANRRVDFGTFTSAAASSKHAKNSKLLFVNSSELANQAVVSGEVLALMSVDVNTDGAVIASNIGGSAAQTATLRISGYIVSNMPSLS